MSDFRKLAKICFIEPAFGLTRSQGAAYRLPFSMAIWTAHIISLEIPWIANSQSSLWHCEHPRSIFFSMFSIPLLNLINSLITLNLQCTEILNSGMLRETVISAIQKDSSVETKSQWADKVWTNCDGWLWKRALAPCNSIPILFNSPIAGPHIHNVNVEQR